MHSLCDKVSHLDDRRRSIVKLHVQKYAALSALALCGLTPSLAFFWLFGTAWLLNIVVLSGASFGIALLYRCHLRKNQTFDQYPLLPKNKKTNAIYAVLKNLSARYGIPEPVLRVFPGGAHKTRAYGTPYTPTLLIGEKLLSLYPKHFNAPSLNALLAHELAHIKNNDIFYNVVCSTLHAQIKLHSFVIFSYAAFLTLSGGLAFLPLVLLSGLCGVSFFIFPSIQRFVKRMTEYIADHQAAQTSGDPKNVALTPYLLSFHLMEKGQLLLGNQIFKVGEKGNQQYQSLLKTIPAKDMAGFYKHRIEKTFHAAHPNDDRSYLAQWKDYLNLTHPTHKERYHAIKSAFPLAFKKSSAKP